MFKGFTGPSQHGRTRPSKISLKASGVGKGRSLALVADCSELGAHYSLADDLRADGWNVAILDLAPPGRPDRNFTGHAYQRLAGQYRETNWYIQMQSLTAYHWLRARSFDAIIFHRGFAAAFYSCMARHLKLAFADTPIIIFNDGTHAGSLEGNMQLPSGRHDFEFDFMERRSVELADGVVAANDHISNFMREAGWPLPRNFAAVSETKATLGQWLEQRMAAKPKAVKRKPIQITVCIATHNRPLWLREALASLEKQTHKKFEVIVVDDGSTDAAVDVVKSEYAPLFRSRKWRWVKQRNAGPAAARNYAAKLAQGDYLLFMDDDDIAYQDEIERFMLATEQGGDIIACILGMHPKTENGFPPTAYVPEREGHEVRPVGWTPIGGDIALAVFVNVSAYAHSLFKKSVFKKLGGFSTDKDAVFEDFEFITRALIAGHRIDIVPEVLMLYRRTRQSRSMGQDIFQGHLNSLRPIAKLLPASLRPLLFVIRNEWYKRHRQRRDGELRD